MKKQPTFDDLVDDALVVFRREYQDSFPIGGDESDHDAAERAAIEAVLISTPICCRHCGEWT
ncbi:MAG TPA: hypothetical protein VK631_23840 [Solirubrobacteraceae bacterium]|nr:hypothetical protein [Solirubrobacteraceae bacterium]